MFLKDFSCLKVDRPLRGLWDTPRSGVCHTPLCTVARDMVFVVFERASVPKCFSLSVGRFFVLRKLYVIVLDRHFMKTYQTIFRVVKWFQKCLVEFRWHFLGH